MCSMENFSFYRYDYGGHKGIGSPSSVRVPLMRAKKIAVRGGPSPPVWLHRWREGGGVSCFVQLPLLSSFSLSGFAEQTESLTN